MKMIVDFCFGIVGIGIGLYFGLNDWFSLTTIFLCAFILDVDIVLNESIRIFIKKEKNFNLNTLLDEFSYTHKFIFHLPLIVLPVVYFIGFYCGGNLLGVFYLMEIFFHLVHDTLDRNFDGVPWFYPFSNYSYKFRNGCWEVKSRWDLEVEAKNKKTRTTKKILNSNLF